MPDIKIGSKTYEDVKIVNVPLSDDSGYASFVPKADGNENVELTVQVTAEYEATFYYNYYDDDGILQKNSINVSTLANGNYGFQISVAKGTIVYTPQFRPLTAEFTSINSTGSATIFYKYYYYGFAFIVDGESQVNITLTQCCFVAGTQVLIDFDGNTKNIEDMAAGDTVVSYNIETGKNYLTEVKRLAINKKSLYMADVTLSDGTIVTMTDYHPLYCKDGWKSLTGYKGYDILTIGDEVKTINGYSTIKSINQYALQEPIWTYTLDVRDAGEEPDDDTNDNFYANGIVAHNASCMT